MALISQPCISNVKLHTLNMKLAGAENHAVLCIRAKVRNRNLEQKNVTGPLQRSASNSDKGHKCCSYKCHFYSQNNDPLATLA